MFGVDLWSAALFRSIIHIGAWVQASLHWSNGWWCVRGSRWRKKISQIEGRRGEMTRVFFSAQSSKIWSLVVLVESSLMKNNFRSPPCSNFENDWLIDRFVFVSFRLSDILFSLAKQPGVRHIFESSSSWECHSVLSWHLDQRPTMSSNWKNSFSSLNTNKTKRRNTSMRWAVADLPLSIIRFLLR